MLARLLLLANLSGIGAYILWQGASKFYIEAFGTWMLSPLILLRMSPVPLKNWLLRTNSTLPILCDVVCLVPVVMFAAALVLGIWGARKGSFPLSFAACILLTSIFVVYHSVKHMGIQLVVN